MAPAASLAPKLQSILQEVCNQHDARRAFAVRLLVDFATQYSRTLQSELPHRYYVAPGLGHTFSRSMECHLTSTTETETSTATTPRGVGSSAGYWRSS